MSKKRKQEYIHFIVSSSALVTNSFKPPSSLSLASYTLNADFRPEIYYMYIDTDKAANIIFYGWRALLWAGIMPDEIKK